MQSPSPPAAFSPTARGKQICSSKALDDFERRVREDHLDADRRFGLRQEITDEIERKIARNDVGGDDGVPAFAEHSRDGAAAGRRLPYCARDLLDAEQRLDGHHRRFVEIEPTFGVGVTLHLATVV
jgi:hypothetical protein